jgi:hypothetical protein
MYAKENNEFEAKISCTYLGIYLPISLHRRPNAGYAGIGKRIFIKLFGPDFFEESNSRVPIQSSPVGV